MTETYGSRARVRWDKPQDRLNPKQTEKHLHRIIELTVEVRHAFIDAVEGGVYPIRQETNGRGKGFEESDPTHTAATRPTQRQLRGTARYAAGEIARAVQALEEAAWMLHRGLLLTDPQVLEWEGEKRRAATQE